MAAAADDVVWVDVLPSLKDLMPTLRKQLVPAGKQAGQDFGKALADGVDQASSRLAASRKKEADAIGTVRVAEAKLKDLRDKGRASAAQLVAAEENLSRAKRTLDERTDAVARSTRGLSDAQEKAAKGAKGLDDGLSKSRRSAGLLSSTVGKLGGVLAGLSIGRAFVGFVKDAQESARISRLTEAAIKSTGGAANVTAKQVGDLSTAISNKTAVDDETVQSASNVLLAFTRVRNETGKGNDVFNKATQAAIDMSAAMGTDANAAAKQLGRALNDPIGSLGALSRAGVQFTDQQKEQIKTLVESGDTLGAQKIILDQVGDRFGGAAAAAADPMERLKTVAGNLGEELGGALLPAVSTFATWVSDRAVPAIKMGWSWLSERLTPAFRTVSSFVRDSVVPAIKDLAGWMSRNSDVLIPLVGGLGAAFAAFKALMFVKSVIGAIAAFNAVLAANPIGLIIVALVGLGVGLVLLWKKSETFRNIVTGVWEAIQTGAKWMWENVLKPVFTALKAAWDVIGAAIAWAWNNLIKPAWSAVQTTARWLWDNVLKPIFSAIRTGWDAVSKAIVWAWNNIIKPAWNALRDTIKWLWENILKPTFSAIKGAWDTLSRAFNTIWENVLKPVFKKFGEIIGTVKEGFKKGLDGIKALWEGLKDLLKKPIQAVIDVVWNNGIRKLWNTVNNLWGGQDLDEFKLATGGVLPGYTPGRDVHTFVSPTGGVLGLSGGEAVMRPEWTRALGKPTIDYWNHLARTQGVAGLQRAMALGDPPNPQARYAGGGVVGLGTRDTGWLPPSWVMSLVGGQLGTVNAMIADYIRGERSALSGGSGHGLLGEAITGTVAKAANSIWTWIKGKVSGLVEGAASAATGTTNPGGPGISTDRAIAALTWARGQVGAPYLWGGVGPIGYDCSGWISALANVVRGKFPYSRLGNTSSMPWSGFQSGLSGPFQVGVSDNTGSGIGHMAATVMGVNVESAGSVGVRIGGSARGATSSIFPEHYSMVFHRGGKVPRGLGPDVPAVLAPDERVWTAPQDDYFRRFVDVTQAGGSQPQRVYNIQNTLNAAPGLPAIDQLQRMQRRAEVLAGA